MNIFFRKNWTYFVGAIVGAIGGYLYWSEIGCQSGTCPIVSSPYLSTIWGTAIGSLLFGIFKKKTSHE